MPGAGVLSYQKLWTFFQFQLEDKKHYLIRQLSFEQVRNSIKSAITWRRVAFADALIHTVLGFLIVTIIILAVPEVLNDTARLTAFWGVMFSHLFLGFLSIVALYRNWTGTLKFIAVGLILLQMSVLGMASNYKAHCKGNDATVDVHVDDKDLELSQDCRNLSFLSSHMILPNFLHSFIFCGILITFLYKQAGLLEDKVHSSNDFDECDGKLKTQQLYKFAHITVIVEQVGD